MRARETGLFVVLAASTAASWSCSAMIDVSSKQCGNDRDCSARGLGTCDLTEFVCRPLIPIADAGCGDAGCNVVRPTREQRSLEGCIDYARCTPTTSVCYLSSGCDLGIEDPRVWKKCKEELDELPRCAGRLERTQVCDESDACMTSD